MNKIRIYKKGEKLSLVKECYDILEWMEKEARIKYDHPIYSKMKRIKTSLQSVSSVVAGVKNV